MQYELILASQSPRRKELLSHLGVPFKIIPSKKEEVSTASDPVQFSQDIALLKGRDILRQHYKTNAEPVIISADTIVVLDQKIYGKPKSVEEARQMLEILSGKTHSVFTAVAILTKDKEHCFSVESQVSFDPIAESVLAAYLDSKDSMDKAGAYGIQGQSLTFISYLKGSYSNVVGFPLSDFLTHFATFLSLDLEKSDWRKLFV